jgi:hypothetical protein
MPNLVAGQLVGVQPMSQSTGSIFTAKPGTGFASEKYYASEKLRELIRKSKGYREYKDWIGQFIYEIIKLINAGDELDLIREAGFGDYIDSETLRISAKSLLDSQYELADAAANKFEGMSKHDIDLLCAELDSKHEEYEIIRRLVNPDNPDTLLLSRLTY